MIATSTSVYAEPGHEMPVANAGMDQTIIAREANGLGRVILDGSDSTGAIVRYEWSEGGLPISTGVRPIVELSVEAHIITLTVTDEHGVIATDDVTVVIEAPHLPEGFEETVVVRGLTAPIDMAFTPDGRLFVTEHVGRVRVIKDGTLLPTPFLTVPVNNIDERGLRGLALDPNFDTNGYVYVYYTAQGDGLWNNRLSRFTTGATDPNVADPESEVAILNQIRSGRYHNGGALHFGPDGKLYVSTGEAGYAPDEAQRLDRLNGKLLRIDPSNFPDLIPPDNPFVGVPGARGEVWAYGLRNPFVFAIDPVTGTVHINDVGKNSWEEVNLGVKGANYGWPECEGPCDHPAFEDPLYAYQTSSEGCAVTGGTFYRGTQFPHEYDGSYFFTDYCRQWIKRITPEGAVLEFSRHEHIASGMVNLTVGPDGSLYYLSNGWASSARRPEGTLHKIQFVGVGNRHPGAVVLAHPTDGLAPLRVVFSAQDSDDPEGGPLTYRWELGDGSSVKEGVTVQHIYERNGLYDVRLSVTDVQGERDTATALIFVGNRPAGEITTPPEGATVHAGTTIHYGGTGTDMEDGPLPASAFRWWVTLHHHPEAHPHHHTHPFQPPIEGVMSGSFEIPREVHAQDIWWRLHLTVTDSDGLTQTTTRDLRPQYTHLTFTTEPGGLPITLDGQSASTPLTQESIVGSIWTVGAPSRQIVDGTEYRFASWSDGGVVTHAIETPASTMTYTATYLVDPEFDPTLVGYWPLDESQGSQGRQTVDLSGHRNGYTELVNGPTLTAGRIAGALRFDGVDDYVETHRVEDLAKWTVSVWVRSPAAPSEGPATGPVHRDRNYQINWDHPDRALRGAAALRVQGTWHAASFGRLQANRWYHLAATYDGEQLKAYRDGVLVTTNPRPSGAPDPEYESMNFGRHAAAANYFHGTIDDIRLYSRALSAEEVLAVFQKGFGSVLH